MQIPWTNLNINCVEFVSHLCMTTWSNLLNHSNVHHFKSIDTTNLIIFTRMHFTVHRIVYRLLLTDPLRTNNKRKKISITNVIIRTCICCHFLHLFLFLYHSKRHLDRSFHKLGKKPGNFFLWLCKLSCSVQKRTEHSKWPLHLYFEDVSSVDKRSFIAKIC